MNTLSRRCFLASAPVGVVGVAGLAATQPASILDDTVLETYPGTPGDRASEFVAASHGRTDRVREMLAEDAGLAKAAWDWGFGDWESAIEAASHTGQIEIIELLIAHGARPTVFTLATLDAIDSVRPALESIPNIDNLEGPHSISLYRHAELGKADRVLDYLQNRGITDTNPFATERESAEKYFGTYAWSDESEDRFLVDWSERISSLRIKRPKKVARNLIPLGDHAFSPAGARHVKLRFEMSMNSISKLIIPWAGMTLEANRIS
jgi:hypothetical protein